MVLLQLVNFRASVYLSVLVCVSVQLFACLFRARRERQKERTERRDHYKSSVIDQRQGNEADVESAGRKHRGPQLASCTGRVMRHCEFLPFYCDTAYMTRETACTFLARV